MGKAWPHQPHAVRYAIASRSPQSPRRCLALLAAFAARVPIARYYVYVTWATVHALWNYLRHGVPAAWDPASTR